MSSPKKHRRTESMEIAFQCLSPFAIPGAGSPVKKSPVKARTAPVLALKPMTPFSASFTASGDCEELVISKPAPRTRVNSNTRRSALGWAKRKGDKVTEEDKSATIRPIRSSAMGKENEGVGTLKRLARVDS